MSATIATTIPIVPFVMAGLDPAIHDVPVRTKLAASGQRRRVDGRIKSGHDVTIACVYPDKNGAGQPWVEPGHGEVTNWSASND
jgi:hypothetical protein